MVQLRDPGSSWVIDLDGVMWLEGVAIDGSAAAIERLRAAGCTVTFATNFSYAPVGVTEERLAAIGVDARGCVVTSAMAAAVLVQAGERVHVCGGPGIVEAVEARGGLVVEGEADVVIVGFDPAFDYERLEGAASAVLGGARLIGTNDDPTLPGPHGLRPGGGSLLAAVAYASGTTPIVAGKPNEPMATLLRSRLGATGVMIGDRLDTDGGFAARLGFDFGLVLSGSTAASAVPTGSEAPWMVASDLAAIVDAVLRA